MKNVHQITSIFYKTRIRRSKARGVRSGKQGELKILYNNMGGKCRKCWSEIQGMIRSKGSWDVVGMERRAERGNFIRIP